jgi:hypothetical protein
VFRRIMRVFARPGDVILYPFAGGGATLVEGTEVCNTLGEILRAARYYEAIVGSGREHFRRV